MFAKQYDIICIGDVASDAFIRLKEAHINCKIDKHNCEICFPFGDKVPFEYTKIIKGVGNAANAAVASARMGLHTAIVSNVGDDQNGRDCRIELEKNKVNISYVKVNKDKPSNYHFVLWYDVDRTILVNHIEYDYRLPKFPAPKWLYLTSIGNNSSSYYKEISDYLNANPKIKLAFQPGSQQIRLGYHELEIFYKKADVFIVNLEEAEKILLTTKVSGSNFKNDPKSMLKYFSQLGPKLIIITDGPNGAYASSEQGRWFMPIYPDLAPPFERTGAGDAFASTFTAALMKGKPIEEALMWGPVNSMNVVQQTGAQEGLLSESRLREFLDKAPEWYVPKPM
jgi:ribokinase